MKTLEERLSETISKYDRARDSELLGWDALAREDLDAAAIHFGAAEQEFPTLHSVSEINSLPQKAPTHERADPESRQQLYGRIVTDYSWKAPQGKVEALKRRVESGNEGQG